MKSRSLFLAVGVMLAAMTQTATAYAAPAPAPSTSQVGPSSVQAVARTAATYAAEATRAVNRQRHRHDRKRLRVEVCLTAQAQARAAAMARSGLLQHSALGRLQSACSLGSAGENIAYGYASGSSAVNAGWMHSAGHRQNILRRPFRVMGVAAAVSPRGVWYVALVLGRH